MFLITTADERTWRKDDKILFLGEWCKLYSRKHIWSGLDFEVLPYHWDDRRQLYLDYQYLGIVYERYLKEIAQKLNSLHGTKHGLRYWRIIIGPWLRYFSDTIFDRYCSLKAVADKKVATSTCLLISDAAIWVPKDFGQFCSDQITDQWNNFIFGHIIKLIGSIPYHTINEYNCPLEENRRIDKSSVTKRFFRYAADQYSKIIPKNFNTIAFVSSYFNVRNVIKLQLSLGQMPNPYCGIIEPPNLSVNNNLRDQLKVSIAANEFERVLETLIPLQIPIAYVEAFQKLRDLAGYYYPGDVSAIYTANAYSGDEGFKVWCAEKAEKGVKFMIGQHGGNMGTSLWSQSEDHQVAISDRFFSWGWTNREKNNIKPLPSCKLIGFRKKLSSDAKGPILWVMASLPRYSYCMYSVPVSSQFLGYMNSQITFAKSLSKPVFDLLRMRHENTDFGWSFDDRLKDSGLGGIPNKNNGNFIQSFRKSRLTIATHNATVFLETFASNHPTLIFWNPGYYELRPEAQKYFDELRRAGILHDTPESAAATLNEIYKDPLSWWRQSEIQAVKDYFCGRFAYTADNWLQQWKEELSL